MEIVITGRRTDVPERFRRQAEDKLSKIAQFAPRAHRVDVELSHERNPRQANNCKKVEITVRDKGPVIRAEASAEEPAAALDLAFGKLLERLRRLGDRRKVHHGRQTPASVRARPGNGFVEPPDVAAIVSADGAASAVPQQAGQSAEAADTSGPGPAADSLEGSPVVIRTKEHRAVPMSLDQALYEMELVGHDFFLFVDADSGCPSVVYRRRGWNYGLIRLQVETAEASIDTSL